MVTWVEPPKSSFQRAAHEVAVYRGKPKLPNTEQPLEWWKQHTFRFPLLSVLAAALPSVPATSVSSERAFSTAGDIVTQQRTSLKPTTWTDYCF